MTWRAFLIGIVGVAVLNFLTPINDYALGNTFLTGNHFPVGVLFFLLLLTLGLNLLIKLVRRAAALTQSELMLVFCMMLVSATVPASGLMRYWPTTTAAAPYLAQRQDLFWEESVLEEAPEGILVSKNPRSPVARQFYRGTPEDERVRVPWRRWGRVALSWGSFIWLYYLATWFLFGLLRRQWVERERLTFPLARVPMELTEGSGGQALLPSLLRSKAFLAAAAITVLFGVVRLSPLFFGAETGWTPAVPFNQMLVGTTLQRIGLANGFIFPIGIGFAFLVPADISLSMWVFYLFTCLEVQVAYAVGRPLPGGPWSAFMSWQQAGAFIAFSVALLWMARRHLLAVAKKALGVDPSVDDADEPIPYRVGFWGLLLTVAGMIGWYVYFGMNLLTAAVMLGLVFSIVMVHARLVTQGGLFFTQETWNPPNLLHDITGGQAFSGPAAVLAQMQHTILTYDAREILSPHAMNSLRISSVFKKHRRWFLPIMLVALLVAMVFSGYSTLRYVYYDVGALNVKQTHSVLYHPQQVFNRTHEMISNPVRSARPHPWALGIGGGLMIALTMLRRTFYWWPVHALGFLVASSWCIRQLWFSFFLGWLAKVAILKFGTGPLLRQARTFFVGVIVTEIAVVGLTTVVSLITGVRTGYVFLSH